MTPAPNRSNSNTRTISTQVSSSRSTEQESPIDKALIKTIDELKDGLSKYPIRLLVEQTEKFGMYLQEKKLETNQVRKFLDAINRLKSDLAQNQNDFSKIETEVVLLKPKLAYAAARQQAAKPLSDVMSKAIDRVHNAEDFNRLVQFVESIIAYHKAAGGR